jgi:hypothetical protein
MFELWNVRVRTVIDASRTDVVRLEECPNPFLLMRWIAGSPCLGCGMLGSGLPLAASRADVVVLPGVQGSPCLGCAMSGSGTAFDGKQGRCGISPESQGLGEGIAGFGSGYRRVWVRLSQGLGQVIASLQTWNSPMVVLCVRSKFLQQGHSRQIAEFHASFQSIAKQSLHMRTRKLHLPQDMVILAWKGVAAF